MKQQQYLYLVQFLCWLSYPLAVNTEAGYPTIFPSLESTFYGNIKNVKLILLDEPNNKVYFVAQNKLCRASLDLQDDIKVEILNPVAEDCKYIGSRENACHNVIKSLDFDFGGKINVCGTNAQKQKCWKFQNSSFKLSVTMSGRYRSPKFHTINVTTLFAHNKVLVASTFYRLPKICKSLPNTGMYAEMQTDDTAFSSGANFVSSYDFSDGYTYFFFREFPVENKERQVVYSRVGRICKHETGSPYVRQKLFLTFLKTQLVCKKTGTSAYVYYDELQSTFMMDVHLSSTTESYIYGVFLTSSGSSAICRYRIKDIIHTLNTSPKKKKKNGAWVAETFSNARQNMSRPVCNNKLVSDSIPAEDLYHEATTDSLLNDKIQQFDRDPLWTSGLSMTSLVIEDLHFHNDSSDVGIHVLFVGAVNGKIYKISTNSTAGSHGHIVDIIEPFQNKQPIYTLKKSSKDIIYAGSGSGIAAFSVQRCSSYLLCKHCIQLRDPYCAWSISQSKCMEAKQISKSDRLQDIVNGNYQQCPKPANDFTCSIGLKKYTLSSGVQLECTPSTKKAKVVGWSRYGSTGLNTPIHSNDVYEVMTSVRDIKGVLTIKNYTVQYAGKYACIVELNDNRQSCSIPVKAEATTTLWPQSSLPGSSLPLTTVVTSLPLSSLPHLTTKVVFTVPNTGDRTEKKFYETAFYIAVVVALLLVVIIICVCCKLRLRNRNNGTEVDGRKVNGRSNGHRLIKYPFCKNSNVSEKENSLLKDERKV